MSSTHDYSLPEPAFSSKTLRLLKKLARQINAVDAVVIGAGSGLSTAAGLAYSGDRFEQNFADFIAKYQYADMYSAGFYPYETLEEYWAYWSRHVYLNRYATDGGAVYKQLMEIVSDKNYFVVTTNVDHCFQKAGFNKERIFYTQGDYGLWQCSVPCAPITYDNEDAVHQMVVEQKDMRIPAALIPYCPRCGSSLDLNLRKDDTFVQDAGWMAAALRYQDYLQANASSGKSVLFWELGVGGNTPGIIKYPFWQMTLQNPRAVYACINNGEAVAPAEVRGQSILIDADIALVLNFLSSDDYGNGRSL